MKDVLSAIPTYGIYRLQKISFVPEYQRKGPGKQVRTIRHQGDIIYAPSNDQGETFKTHIFLTIEGRDAIKQYTEQQLQTGFVGCFMAPCVITESVLPILRTLNLLVGQTTRSSFNNSIRSVQGETKEESDRVEKVSIILSSKWGLSAPTSPEKLIHNILQHGVKVLARLRSIAWNNVLSYDNLKSKEVLNAFKIISNKPSNVYDIATTILSAPVGGEITPQFTATVFMYQIAIINTVSLLAWWVSFYKEGRPFKRWTRNMHMDRPSYINETIHYVVSQMWSYILIDMVEDNEITPEYLDLLKSALTDQKSSSLSSSKWKAMINLVNSIVVRGGRLSRLIDLIKRQLS